MKINANEIKVGMLIEYKDDLWEILKTQHVKPGKGGAFCQVEMKSINKNTKLNERFRSNDTIEKANIENIEFSYLYDDEINYYFINQKNFEQVDVKKNIIEGLSKHGYKEGHQYIVIKVPNIIDISYGRGVGYTFTEHNLGEEIHKISATNIRKEMRSKGDLKEK